MVKDAVPLGECRRALVLKLRHHGDVLLAAPVLSVLKARAPGIEVDALVYDDTAPMLEGHPALSRLHVVGRKWRSQGSFSRLGKEIGLFNALRARRYDLLVHLSEQLRGAWLARWLGVRYSVAREMADRGRFWQRSFTHLYPIAPRRHMIELNLDALRRIGIQPAAEERKVMFVPGAQAEQAVSGMLDTRPFVHLHPASHRRSKCWPAEKNAELIERFSAEGLQVVVTAAPDETQMIDEILAKCRSRPLNLAGKLSLKQLGAVAARARLFVGVDSMPMHLAAAMGVPTVALFEPSGESERRRWNVAYRVIRNDHSSRPSGQDGCGDGKVSECLPVEAVHAAARELLAQARAPLVGAQ